MIEDFGYLTVPSCLQITIDNWDSVYPKLDGILLDNPLRGQIIVQNYTALRFYEDGTKKIKRPDEPFTKFGDDSLNFTGKPLTIFWSK